MGLRRTESTLYIGSAMGALWCILPFPAAWAQVADPSTLNNKILAGYQGWFNAPGDDSGGGWVHWSRSSADIGPGLYTVEMWPDVSEFDAEELFPAPHVRLVDGSTGQLFSSRTLKTVERHFKWMKENGIDGITIGRFITDYGGTDFQNQSRVLENILSAATTHGRVFMVYYDTTGQSTGTLYDNITRDWRYLVNTYDITHHPRYLHHNGKPVVGVWGIGVGDRPTTPTTATQIISFFKNEPTYGGNCMLGGIARGWRDQTGGLPDPAWAAIYRSLDVISPWTVGSYGDANGINDSKTTYTVPDLAECNGLGIGYLQVVWPGFSWNNLQQYPPGSPDIPRNGGQFFWDQVSAFRSAGVNMMLLAMFDEVDEGTAILKVTENHPTTDNWVDYAGYPHDWYMRLAGAATRMLRGEIPVSSSLPATIPIDSTCNGDEVSINLGEDAADRMTHPQNADGDTVVTTAGGISCRKNVSSSGDRYFYFAVNDSFAYAGNRHELAITVDYYNPTGSSGSLRLEYDSDGGGIYKSAGTVALGTDNTWRRKIWHIADAYFGNRQNAGADFRIFKTTTGTFYLDRVLVSSTVSKPPVIKLNKTSLAFQAIALGTQAANDSFTLINMGVAPLNYTVSTDAPWVSVTPPTGRSTGETDTLTVTYNTPGVSRGHHLAAISVTDATASNSPQTIAVDLEVVAFADFDSDGDVDQEDFGRFQACLSGSGVSYAQGCLAGDSNQDSAVDEFDARSFLNCMNGPDQPPGC
jgi:hypothetical protein